MGTSIHNRISKDMSFVSLKKYRRPKTILEELVEEEDSSLERVHEKLDTESINRPPTEKKKRSVSSRNVLKESKKELGHGT